MFLGKRYKTDTAVIYEIDEHIVIISAFEDWFTGRHLAAIPSEDRYEILFSVLFTTIVYFAAFLYFIAILFRITWFVVQFAREGVHRRICHIIL